MVSERGCPIKWRTTPPTNWTRVNPIYTVGNGTSNDEINEGGYVINQLTPNRRYRLAVTYSGSTRYFNVNNDQPLSPGRYTCDVIW